jgi:hypothetical protein
MRCIRPTLTSLLAGVVLGATLLGSSAASAQPFGDNPFMAQQPAIPDIEYDPGGEFNFVRVQFDTWQGGGGGGWGYFGDGGPTWSIDFPGADMNFLRGVSRLTNIRVMRDPIVLRFDDERIFDYPFLYMLEVGQQGGIMLSEEEIANVREYLLRGGFLLIDDFWGERQWRNFHDSFSQIFPDREIVELPHDHEIFRTYYDIDGPQMIPALSRDDSRGEQGIDVASNHAILDDFGRVMVLINWNSDMGDGWEHTYHPYYPTRYANAAYQLGINYLIYSLTH